MSDIVFGDVIYDVYVQVDNVSPNQEYPSTLKAYLYYFDFLSLFEQPNIKVIPGGAANYFTQKGNKATFITPIFNSKIESKLLSLSKLDKLNIKTVCLNDSRVVNPIKIRFVNNKKILFRFDIEPHSKFEVSKQSKETTTLMYLSYLANTNVNSIEIIDYDKLFIKTLDFELLKQHIVATLNNQSSNIKYVYLMVKPNILDLYIDNLVKPLIEADIISPDRVYVQFNKFEYKKYGKPYLNEANLIITLGKDGFRLIGAKNKFDKQFCIPNSLQLDDSYNFSGAGDIFGAEFTKKLNIYGQQLFYDTNLIYSLFKTITDKIIARQ